MKETEVLIKTHKYLRTCCLWSHKVVRLFTDAHSSLLPHKELRPFQRFTLNMGDFVVHPDLVGQLGDGETIFAVEAKGENDLLKGIGQAELYQHGFHCSFIAADSKALGTRYIEYAQDKGIGIITVSDQVSIIDLPKIRMPFRNTFQFISEQMESVHQISGSNVFAYNIPTHYLVWTIALNPKKNYALNNLPKTLKKYPIPKGWKETLNGAIKLGLINKSGNITRLSYIGEAVKEILQTDLEKWSKVHKIAKKGVPLIQIKPQAAAILKILLLQNPLVRLMVEGLRSTPDNSASFAKLAIICSKLDYTRAQVFFLKPESVERLMDNKGRIYWEQAKGEDYRSKTFYQYKSILRHAGILSWNKLGGSTSVGYDPNLDIWELA